jgi:hypothetical protein
MSPLERSCVWMVIKRWNYSASSQAPCKHLQRSSSSLGIGDGGEPQGGLG